MRPWTQSLAHYRKYYVPSELVVTAAGALDHDEVVALVVKGLEHSGWDLSSVASPATRRDTAEVSLQTHPGSLVVARPLEQAVVALATPGLHATHDQRFAMSVLSATLGGGMSSRLFQEIRERRGLAYSVYSFASSYADAGLFGMAAGTSPANAGNVADLMKQELDLMADKGITEAELERTKGNIAGGSALALESSDARMIRLGRSELSTGEFVDRDEALARLAMVGLAEVQDLAKQLAVAPLSGVVVGSVSPDVLDGVITSR